MQMDRTLSIREQTLLRIPNVATLQVGYDRLRFVSSVERDTLKEGLYVTGIQDLAHHIRIESLKRWSRPYCTEVELTCVDWAKVLLILAQNASLLGTYNFTKVEVACDAPIETVSDTKAQIEARAIISGMIANIGKPRASRKHFVAAREGAKELFDEAVPGLPTFYTEDRRSSVALKFYARFQKARGGKLRKDRILARMEITFSRSSTIKAKFGGSQIEDLLRADLPGIVMKQLTLEEVDYVELGRLLSRLQPITKTTRTRTAKSSTRHPYVIDDNYLEQRRALAFLRSRATSNSGRLNYKRKRIAKHRDQTAEEWDQALEVGLTSPIEIRGHLNELRKKHPSITPYRIKKCFKRKKWRKRLHL